MLLYINLRIRTRLPCLERLVNNVCSKESLIIVNIFGRVQRLLPKYYTKIVVIVTNIRTDNRQVVYTRFFN